MIRSPGAGWRHTVSALSLVLLLGTGAAQCAPASAAASAPGEEARLSAMEQRQQSMLAQTRQKVESLPDSPRRDALLQRLRDIERRTEVQHHTAYVSSSSPMTGDMKAYYARFVRRIEDCGTRHFPQRDGKSVYGKAVASITLDRQGVATRTEVVRSSGNRLVDRHVAKLVRASSPFGPLPVRIAPEQAGDIAALVVVTAFNFERDEKDPVPIADQEQCHWPVEPVTGKGTP